MEFKKQELCINFYLQDPENEVQLFQDLLPNPVRRHELWKPTCFELFLAKSEELSYWEFNFANDGSWNLYHFDDYRKPSPPKEDFAFEMRQLKWRQNQLSILMESKISAPDFQGSFCSVIQTKTGGRHYLSTAHKAEKPDFHQRQSFTIPIHR